MFGDLDCSLNASRGLSAIVEFLVCFNLIWVNSVISYRGTVYVILTLSSTNFKVSIYLLCNNSSPIITRQ